MDFWDEWDDVLRGILGFIAPRAMNYSSGCAGKMAEGVCLISFVLIDSR